MFEKTLVIAWNHLEEKLINVYGIQTVNHFINFLKSINESIDSPEDSRDSLSDD